MNALSINTRVADLVRNPNSALPSKVEHSKKNQSEDTSVSKPQAQRPSSEYSLALSPLAEKLLVESDSYESDWEKSRSERVQRVQQLVQEKQYSMNPEIVDSIAHKIVAMLP